MVKMVKSDIVPTFLAKFYPDIFGYIILPKNIVSKCSCSLIRWQLFNVDAIPISGMVCQKIKLVLSSISLTLTGWSQKAGFSSQMSTSWVKICNCQWWFFSTCPLPGQICRSLRSSSLISVLLPSQTPVWYGWLPYYGVITTWYHWIVTDSAQIVMCFPFSRPGRSDFVGNRKKCEADHPDWWETDFNSWSDIVVTIVDLH